MIPEREESDVEADRVDEHRGRSGSNRPISHLLAAANDGARLGPGIRPVEPLRQRAGWSVALPPGGAVKRDRLELRRHTQPIGSWCGVQASLQTVNLCLEHRVLHLQGLAKEIASLEADLKDLVGSALRTTHRSRSTTKEGIRSPSRIIDIRWWVRRSSVVAAGHFEGVGGWVSFPSTHRPFLSHP